MIPCPALGQYFAGLTRGERYAIQPWMNIEQKVNDWLEAITARNAGSVGPWSARFLIEGFWPVVGAVEDLGAVGGTIAHDGRAEYVLTFPPSKAREAMQLVAEQGGWLCERQTLVPASE